MTSSRRRAYSLALASTGAGAALVWWASSWNWLIAQEPLLPGTSMTDATSQIALTGSQISPLIVGMAVLGLAGIAGIVGSSGWIRRTIGGLIVAAGTVVIVDLGLVIAGSGVESSAPDGAEILEVSVGGAWLALAGGCLMALGGGLTLVQGSSWPGLGRNYERSGSGTPKDAWDALDRGIDPTVDGRDDSN